MKAMQIKSEQINEKPKRNEIEKESGKNFRAPMFTHTKEVAKQNCNQRQQMSRMLDGSTSSGNQKHV